MKNKKTIFIACDTTSQKKIKKIISETNSLKLNIGYKIGLEFFYSKNGRNFLSQIKSKNIFLDLKLNDIPNTCGAALKAIQDLKNIKYITAHINSGEETLRIIKRISRNKYKILGVTVLTSIDKIHLKRLGFKNDIKNVVVCQAKIAKKLKLNGIVCSGQEIKKVKKICKNMEIVVPGIRLPGDKNQDQKRVMTPKKAFDLGASAVVIGRSLTNGNIKQNLKKLIESLK